MKNITFITGSLPPIRCGVGFYARALLGRLQQEGITPRVLTSAAASDDLPGFEVTRLPSWKLGQLPRIARTVKAQRPDIVHIQYPGVGYGRQLGINLLPFWLRLSLPKARLVISLHEYHDSRLLGRIRDLITVTAARQIIVSNQADRQALPFWLRRRTVVIPIGSNIPKLPRDRRRYEAIMRGQGLDPTRPALLFFGFAEPSKGLETLLGALAKVPGLQVLLMTGLDQNNSYQRRLAEQVAELNKTAPRVGVTGFLPDNDISAVLQEGDYFVLPQPKPLTAKASTAITAVDHGLVVLSSGSAQPDISLPYISGQNSLLLAPMSVDSLTQRLQAIAGTAPTAALKNGVADLAQYFSWDNIVRKQREIYGA